MILLNKIVTVRKIFILFGLLFCSSPHQDPAVLSRFDLSEDDSKIIFSYRDEGNTSIHLFDFKEKKITITHNGNNDWSYISPSFFKTKDQIIYIKYRTNQAKESYICTSKISGSEEDCFLKLNGITAEVIAISKEEIVFPMADTVSVSSPIGMKSAKGFDLYRYNLNTEELDKLTNKRYYLISNINRIGNEVIFGINSVQYNGLYLTYGLDSLKSIPPKNDPRNDIGLYSKPVFSEYDSSVVFTAPYQIYKMSLDDLNANLVLDYRGESLITGLNTFHKSSKVLFTIQGDASFYSVNLDGTDLKRIEVDFQN